MQTKIAARGWGQNESPFWVRVLRTEWRKQLASQLNMPQQPHRQPEKQQRLNTSQLTQQIFRLNSPTIPSVNPHHQWAKNAAIDWAVRSARGVRAGAVQRETGQQRVIFYKVQETISLY